MNRAYVAALGFCALGLAGFGPCSKITGGGSSASASASASAAPVASAAAPADSASAAASDPSAAPDPTSVAPPPAPMATAKKDINKASYKTELDKMEKDLRK